MKKNQRPHKTGNKLLMQTLYDLRFPLASMKETLEELAASNELSENVRSKVCTVLQQTAVLHHLADGVAHFLRNGKDDPKERENRLMKIRKYALLYAKRPDNDTRGLLHSCTHCVSDRDWRFIAQVQKHVEEKMDNPGFNIDSLCDLLHMSRTSFYNKLKSLTGQAPVDYVRLIRLNRAQALLKEHRYTITEVADMIGFSDAKYFREVFKKHFGVSPSQYAKDNPLKRVEDYECIS